MFTSKTKDCRHSAPDCVSNASSGFLLNLKYGAMIRCAYTLLQVVTKGGKLKNIKIFDQVRFPLFLASFALVSKLLLCFLRRMRGKDTGINAFISGFAAGFTILINKDPHFKKMFALYLFMKALESVYSKLVELGFAKYWKYGDYLLGIPYTVMINYLFFGEIDVLGLENKQSTYMMCNYVMKYNNQPNDSILLNILRTTINR